MIEAADAPGWRKSSRCDSGYCVEIGFSGDSAMIRDSKQIQIGHLTFEAATFSAFILDVKAGRFDLS